MLKMSGVTPIELELRYDSKKSLEDTKEVIRIGKSKKGTQHNGKQKRGPTTIYKTQHRKQKIELHEYPLRTRGELRCS